jgi:hypothetical protein
MNELRINLDAEVLNVLEQSAKEHGRDVGEEALAILRSVLDRRRDPVEWSRQIRAMGPQKQKTDSLQLIREDRNR